MNLVRVIYEVVRVDPDKGLICMRDGKGEKSEIRVAIEENSGRRR